MEGKSLHTRNSGERFVSRIERTITEFLESALEVRLVHLIGIIFVMYASNSYFGLPSFDSQPFPIFVAIIFIFFRILSAKGDNKTPILFTLVGILSITGLIGGALIFAFSVDMLLFRGLANYFSIFIYLIAFYEYIKTYGFPLKALVFINFLWLLVGFIQLFVPGIVDMFVASRTGIGRGVTSMSPEPSTFGFYLFFISWIYLIVTDYKPPLWLKVLIGINVFFIFFIAKSAMTIAMLLVAALIFMIYNFKVIFTLKGIIITAIGFGILGITIFVILEGSRMEVLFDRLLALEFETIMQTDRSVNSRVGHQVLPLTLFFQNLGLPGGLHYFVTNIDVLDPYLTELLWGNIDMDKIMSWNAAMIYELGIFGVLIWMVLFTLLLDGSNRRVCELIVLFIVLFTSVPISYPIIPLLFTIFYMTNSNFTQRKKRFIQNKKKSKY